MVFPICRSKRKDAIIQEQHKEKLKVQRSKVKEEKTKQEKKAKEAAKAYEDWKTTVNYRPRRGSTGFSSDREPWKPVSLTVSS